MRSHLERERCVGNPWDNPTPDARTCPFDPQFVGVGMVRVHDGSYVTGVGLACELHVDPLMDVLALADPSSAGCTTIDALPLVLASLGSEHVWSVETLTAA